MAVLFDHCLVQARLAFAPTRVRNCTALVALCRADPPCAAARLAPGELMCVMRDWEPINNRCAVLPGRFSYIDVYNNYFCAIRVADGGIQCRCVPCRDRVVLLAPFRLVGTRNQCFLARFL
jgi:hypothetical protein